MSDNVVYRLFPEPIFKYKLKNFENLNKKLSLNKSYFIK